jgi:TRAP-type C4-dicarboxylate transport system permease small subunit
MILRMLHLLERVNRPLARFGLMMSVAGLVAIIVIVAWQVIGRYLLNDSPTWAENLALVLILYVTLIGAAVGVRDAGHIGMESLLVLLPKAFQRRIELAIHVLVAIFGAAMLYNGWVLGASVAPYKLPNIRLSEAWRYVPLAVSGFMIVLFSIEHFLAGVADREVEPAWN